MHHFKAQYIILIKLCYLQIENLDLIYCLDCSYLGISCNDIRPPPSNSTMSQYYMAGEKGKSIRRVTLSCLNI